MSRQHCTVQCCMGIRGQIQTGLYIILIEHDPLPIKSAFAIWYFPRLVAHLISQKVTWQLFCTVCIKVIIKSSNKPWIYICSDRVKKIRKICSTFYALYNIGLLPVCLGLTDCSNQNYFGEVWFTNGRLRVYIHTQQIWRLTYWGYTCNTVTACLLASKCLCNTKNNYCVVTDKGRVRCLDCDNE